MSKREMREMKMLMRRERDEGRRRMGEGKKLPMREVGSASGS